MVNFHPALSGIGKVVNSLWPILHASDDMKRVLGEKPIVSFRRPRNLKDELVRAKLKDERGISVGMKNVVNYVKFVVLWRKEGISRDMGINLRLIVPSIVIWKAWFTSFHVRNAKKNYVGSTITSFRKRFNNHKSSLVRYGKGQTGISGEHLYAHFYEEGHESIENMIVKIIDKTSINELTIRKGFWAYKLSSFVPNGLNIMDFCNIFEVLMVFLFINTGLASLVNCIQNRGACPKTLNKVFLKSLS